VKTSRDHILRRVSCWCLLVPLLFTAGCGGYPEVSPLTYEYSKAIYSITNQKDISRLEEVQTRIEASLSEGKISEEEAELLTDILATAESGNWKDANQSARRLMTDQAKST